MKQIDEIIARVFDIEQDEVKDDLSRYNFEEWDSLHHLLLISELEKDLKIKITIDEMANIETIKQLKDIVITKLN